MKALLTAMIAIFGFATITPVFAEGTCGPNGTPIRDSQGRWVCVYDLLEW